MTPLRLRGKHLLVLVALAVASLGTSAAVRRLFDFKASGGSLSPYLVGYYDVSPGLEGPISPRLYLVNPTPLHLVAYVVFFDDEEQPLACTKPDLSANDLEVVDVDAFVGSANNPSQQGVIKIVTFDAEQPGVEVQAGVHGWIRHQSFQVVTVPVNETHNETIRVHRPLVEGQLKEVPEEVLFRDVIRGDGSRRPTELDLIVNACP